MSEPTTQPPTGTRPRERYERSTSRNRYSELPRNDYGCQEQQTKRAEVTARPESPSFRFHTFGDLAKMPRLPWLIRGLLLKGITSVINGDSGTFKTFLALCMALCVATGRDFFGREVKQGTVVYVAAEGFWTIYDRALAWALHHGCELPENFYILNIPVNLSDAAALEWFAREVSPLNPSLIVFDTLSQCATGLVENSKEDMARWIAGMMTLGQRLGAHVSTTHHNAKSSGTLRGATSIHNNVDARISLDLSEDDPLTVFARCEKQRGKPFEPFALHGVEVELPDCDEYGDPITSLVFESCGDVVTPKAAKHSNSKRADKTRDELLEIFDDLLQKWPDGVKAGTWNAQAKEKDVCSGGSFWRHLEHLADERTGQIEKVGDLYRRCTPTTPNKSGSSGDQDPLLHHYHHSHNPLGVGVVGVDGMGVVAYEATKPKPQSKKRRAAAEAEAYRAPIVNADEDGLLRGAM